MVCVAHKKNPLFAICSIALTILTYCQDNLKEFAKLKRDGDSLYEIKDYRNSAISYSSAIPFAKDAGEIILNNTRWQAASSWSLGNYPDSAFAYLNTIANSKDLSFSYFNDLITDNDFKPLYDDNRWLVVKNKIFSSAKITFTNSMLISGGIVPVNELFSTACAWALTNNRDSAFSYLQLIANSKRVTFGNYNNIRTVNYLASLYTDNRWYPFLEKIYTIAESSFLTPEDSTYTQEEIIYGRKDGMALTMMHLRPSKYSNGKAIIRIISSSWRSSFTNWDSGNSLPFLKKGYSVFVVVHGSSPVYTIADAISDIQRAVRFIRFNANKYQVDPYKIGMTGASAGGHLSLLCGLMDDAKGGENSGDPVDRVSAKIQAVACYYPPSDFQNWEAEGQNIMKSNLFKATVFNHVLEFRNWNPQRRLFNYITDTTEIKRIIKYLSPIEHVSANDPPVFIIHGDRDETVPLKQSESLVKKLQEVNVPVSLVIKKGAGHGWDRNDEETKMFIEWFDKYLK